MCSCAADLRQSLHLYIHSLTVGVSVNYMYMFFCLYVCLFVCLFFLVCLFACLCLVLGSLVLPLGLVYVYETAHYRDDLESSYRTSVCYILLTVCPVVTLSYRTPMYWGSKVLARCL